MKKTVYMIAASLLLFFALAYVDEYEALILPLLKDQAGSSEIEEGTDFTEKKLHKFLVNFNEQLSDAYNESNPAKAWELPASSQVQRSVHDELVYNLTNNIRIEVHITEIVILRIDKVSPSSASVVILEKTGGAGGRGKQSAIAYKVEKNEKGLLVTAMEYVEPDEGRQVMP